MQKSKLLILFTFFLLHLSIIAQETKEFELHIVREVTPEKKIESYLEIRDSVMAFIDLLKERWGEEQDIDGKITWKNVSIDSIEGKLEVRLYHAILKPNETFSKTISISKKPRNNEIRVIRLRFLQKERDVLSARQSVQYVKDYFFKIYEEICRLESDEEE